MTRYADIVLPLAQPAYTFAVEEGMALCEGCAVAVRFGRGGRYCTGVVWRLHDERPPFERVRAVERVLCDGAVLVDERHRALWEWMADYYLCSPGEVMRFALPPLMKPSGATAEAFAADEFRPRTELYVALDDALHDAGRFDAAAEALRRRAPRQYAVLAELAAAGGGDDPFAGELPRRLLAADAATLRALERKGLVRLARHERSVDRPADRLFRLPELTPAQKEALAALRTGWECRSTALLHGVTGSGKTEIYMHLAAETLARGEDVLMLVPEIALTAQLIERLEATFGSRVTAYHSKLTPLRRTETFLRLARSAGGEFVVGARSALFLPLRRPGLLIVDEEHDTGYKQTDSQPRYQARDAAVALGRLWGVRTLLGSATPSLESYVNACTGKYALATLAERYGDAVPPRIVLSDTLRAVKRGERHAHFNQLLLDRLAATLDAGRQAMLLQNRRGFAPYVECTACGWTPRCPQCNVTLTYHKRSERLVCHYCGHAEPLPARCPQCDAGELRPMGFGTEKVEEELQRLLPAARIERLDRDTATSESAYRAIIARFAAGETDILVGTQMIAKGFDFARVGLVGILNADNLLLNPDFRAAERAFQLMTQVAGRAGRRDAPGEVVIQTSEPDHPVLRQVLAGDYAAMARCQLAERQTFGYPPYARLTAVTLRDADRERLYRAAGELGEALRARFGRRVLGPVTPSVDRVRGEWIVQLLLKVERGASASRARALLREILAATLAPAAYRPIRVSLDVDPQ